MGGRHPHTFGSSRTPIFRRHLISCQTSHASICLCSSPFLICGVTTYGQPYQPRPAPPPLPPPTPTICPGAPSSTTRTSPALFAYNHLHPMQTRHVYGITVSFLTPLLDQSAQLEMDGDQLVCLLKKDLETKGMFLVSAEQSNIVRLLVSFGKDICLLRWK